VRVAVVSSEQQLNSSYRAMQPAQALARAGHAVHVRATEEQRLTFAELRAFDVVFVYRWSERATQALVQRLRQAGVGIVWDNDDDLTAYPSQVVESRVKGALRSQKMAAQVQAMLALADVVTTTSATLAGSFRARGAADVRIVENFVASEFADCAARERARGSRLVVGWVAAGEHLHDVNELGLRETLRALLDAHEQLELHSVGIDLGLDRDRYRALGYVPFRELPALVAGFDVGIAPLADEPFNRARSNVKLKEYAALGVPWLASPIGPYAGMGEREGGRLVADDGWREALERLVERPRERRRLAKRARRWARTQTLARNGERWVEAVAAAYASASGTSGTGTAGVRATLSASTSR
jgi:glycosyltransferase involved in cell wall biosynthesis